MIEPIIEAGADSSDEEANAIFFGTPEEVPRPLAHAEAYAPILGADAPNDERGTRSRGYHSIGIAATSRRAESIVGA